jgi:hypothetical protein
MSLILLSTTTGSTSATTPCEIASYLRDINAAQDTQAGVDNGSSRDGGSGDYVGRAPPPTRGPDIQIAVPTRLPHGPSPSTVGRSSAPSHRHGPSDATSSSPYGSPSDLGHGGPTASVTHLYQPLCLTLVQYQHATSSLDYSWPGPNGSSSSTDTKSTLSRIQHPALLACP